MGYQHWLKIEPDVGRRAVDALREFGDWARSTFKENVSVARESDLPILDELLEEHPNGYDWTGYSNAVLLHSPNQVVYVSVDNPNRTKLVRDLLPMNAWPSTTHEPDGIQRDVFQIPMNLGMIDSPTPMSLVLWWEGIAWPQFVGPEAMSTLFKIMDRWDALRVWASIAEAEYYARRTFDQRLGDLVVRAT